MEIWKEIPNTNGDYQISSLGRVKSKKWGDWKILNPHTEKTGYKGLKIRYVGSDRRKNVLVHWLVADAFLDRPKGKVEINHIDSDRTNNKVENLEFVTSSGNTEHAVKKGRLIPWNKPRKPIVAINLETNEQMEFISISKAELYFNSRHISDVLKGKRTMVKGYTFKYKGGD
jgi:hypothetical protein